MDLRDKKELNILNKKYDARFEDIKLYLKGVKK